MLNGKRSIKSVLFHRVHEPPKNEYLVAYTAPYAPLSRAHSLLRTLHIVTLTPVSDRTGESRVLRRLRKRYLASQLNITVMFFSRPFWSGKQGDAGAL